MLFLIQYCCAPSSASVVRWELTVPKPVAEVTAAIERRAGADQPARAWLVPSPNQRLRALIATLTAQRHDTGEGVRAVIGAMWRMINLVVTRTRGAAL